MKMHISNHFARFKFPGRMARGIAAAALVVMALAWSAERIASAKPAKENPLCAVEIVVTGGDKNVPVDNASVYLRYEEPRFLRHPRKIELDLKTDMAGIAKVKDVPQIKVLIQVVKDGWRPFGQYYVLDKEQQTIRINLKSPPHWY